MAKEKDNPQPFDAQKKLDEMLAKWGKWGGDWNNFVGARWLGADYQFRPMTLEQRTEIYRLVVKKFPQDALRERKKIYQKLKPENPDHWEAKIEKNVVVDYMKETQPYSWPLFVDAEFDDGLKLQPLAIENNLFPHHVFEEV